MKAIFFLIISLLLGSSSPYIYYVKSNISDLCPAGHPCETLSYYASNGSKCFTDNARFLFLSGTHLLTTTIEIVGSANVTLMANIGDNVTVTCNGSVGLIFQGTKNVTLIKLSFVSCGQPLPHSLQRDGETAQAALAFGEVTDLKLDSISVTYSKGFGILGHCIHGNFTIANSALSYNNGSAHFLGGNAAIEYTNCSRPAEGVETSLTILSSNFTYGDYKGYNYINYTGTLATGLMLILSHTNITVMIKRVIMEGNQNNIHPQGFGGNLFLHFFNETNFTSNEVTIQDSKFINGRSWTGGGIHVSFYTNNTSNTAETGCKNLLTILNTNISQNKAIIGSGLYVNFELASTAQNCPFNKVIVSNCNLKRNALDILQQTQKKFIYLGNGVAVHIINTYPSNKLGQQITGHFKVFFENTNFTNSYTIYKDDTQGGVSKLTALGITVAIANAEELNIKNCRFVENDLTALAAYRTKIKFWGNIAIANNTGVNGGGVMLCESSYIIFTNHTKVNFLNNHAIQSGGGIFVERECLRSKPFCFFQFDSDIHWNCTDANKTVSIIMVNNTAGYAGDHIYGGSLDNCNINNCNSTNVFHSLFQIIPNQTGSSLSAVTSDPRKICYCDQDKVNCTNDTIRFPKSIFPGDKINFSAVIVGQFDGTVPGTVLISQKDSILKPTVHTTRKTCTPLIINIATGKSDFTTIKLQLLSSMNMQSSKVQLNLSEPLYVKIPIKPCPPGFNHNNNVCECDEKLKVNGILCDIDKQTILRTPPAWIGYNNKSDGEIAQGIIYHEVCPYDYCVTKHINITSNNAIFNQDSQCASNRTGVLCSKCKEYNTKLALSLFVMINIFAGIILVFVLVIFDVAYTDGKFSGLQFYANIVYLNSYIFFPSRRSNVLTVVISLMNFSSGLKACSYGRMDSYAKAWLSFGFPVYLFILTAVLIFLCRKSERIARLLSKNIIQVLATLILLSYTKLIQSVVTVLSFTVIHYPSSSSATKTVPKLVWLYDPSLEYFSGKHIPLALVAIVFGLLIVAYTLMLLCVQPLQRYSHLRCFLWVAKLKPLIDAYTAPHIIKDNCRYWEGLLLLFRLILAVAFASNIGNKIDINLIAISLSCVLLLTIAWSVGGVYKKTYLNVLNSANILNLAVLSITMSFIVKNKYQTKLDAYRSITYSSLAVTVVILLVLSVHQVYVKIKVWCLKCRRKRYHTLPLDTSDRMPSLRQFPTTDR